MNEEDQILILDYIDGELDESGQTKALELLATDPELKDFFERSKSTISQLQGELNSPQALAMEERLKDLVLSHEKLNKSSKEVIQSLKDFLSGKLFLTNLATASLAAFSFFAIPISLNLADSTSLDYEDIFNNYDSTSLVEFEVLKTRGIEDNILLEKFELFFREMIDQEKLNSSVKYGDENYILSLDALVYFNHENTVKCYTGKIYSSKQIDVVFCNSDEKTSLLSLD